MRTCCVNTDRSSGRSPWFGVLHQWLLFSAPGCAQGSCWIHTQFSPFEDLTFRASFFFQHEILLLAEEPRGKSDCMADMLAVLLRRSFI